MKTTIEVKGFEIVIDETEDSLTVTAMKEGETVEEFELSLSDEDSEEGVSGEEEVQDFEDFEDEMDSEDSDDDDDMGSDDSEDEMDAADLDDGVESEEDVKEDSEVKLESFQSFINKRK